MSEAAEVPTNVGRNEPCPCGSGKKYKKCCMNAHRVQKEAEKSSREPHQLIAEHTTVWDMYKLIVSACENNMPKFLWEASHDAGPWREKYPTAASYFEKLGDGSENMIARPGSDLLRIRHDAEDALLLLVRNDVAEVVTLRPNETDADGKRREMQHWGWRIWNVERHDVPKDVEELTFDDLGYTWTPVN